MYAVTFSSFAHATVLQRMLHLAPPILEPVGSSAHKSFASPLRSLLLASRFTTTCRIFGTHHLKNRNIHE